MSRHYPHGRHPVDDLIRNHLRRTGAERADATDPLTSLTINLLRDLRGQIGVVTQETLLFDDSSFENIRYGKPDATPDEVEEAARKAYVTDFVSQLPDGFDTLVVVRGAAGGQVSGGLCGEGYGYAGAGERHQPARGASPHR